MHIYFYTCTVMVESFGSGQLKVFWKHKCQSIIEGEIVPFWFCVLCKGTVLKSKTEFHGISVD